jgi:hypothetical protein
MNWAGVGGIAETEGAVAVELGFVYLTIQIRQNVGLVRAATDYWVPEASHLSGLAYDASDPTVRPQVRYRESF